MKGKKIGLLALALVLALGALGVGYASWTDTIFINGTVETGSVELEIKDCSNTWVWKVLPHEIWVQHSYDSVTSEPLTAVYCGGYPEPNLVTDTLISWADADDTSTAERKQITVTFGNAFPCTELTADCVIHYNGSIPAMVDAYLTGDCVDLTTGDNDNGIDDCAVLCQYFNITFYELDETYPGTGDVDAYLGEQITSGPVQMHYCDYVYCEATLDLPQDNTLMNLGCSFTAEIKATQWNECPTT
jgi:hypothetical protein